MLCFLRVLEKYSLKNQSYSNVKENRPCEKKFGRECIYIPHLIFLVKTLLVRDESGNMSKKNCFYVVFFFGEFGYNRTLRD